MPSQRYDAIVVGAGVVGIACARSLAFAGLRTLLLERESEIGQGISARGSKVIHAGLYYKPGSLKAKLCRRGHTLLYKYCTEKNVPMRRLGKLVVACGVEDGELEALYANALSNGVEEIDLLSAAQARMLEPEVQCSVALHSRSTGIVDSHTYMLAMLCDFEAAGGIIRKNVEVLNGTAIGQCLELHTATECLQARIVINAAGLDAPTLATQFSGLKAEHVPQRYYAKGNYFALQGASPFARLVYPMPIPGGLGIHLTLDLHGQARFGPDVEWVDAPEYDVTVARKADFAAAIRNYWPGCREDRLVPAYAGVRPKIGDAQGIANDFVIQDESTHCVPGLINLFGIESPGLTSSLAIAEHVSECLGIHAIH